MVATLDDVNNSIQELIKLHKYTYGIIETKENIDLDLSLKSIKG